MKKFKIEVKEILSRVISISAKNQNDAIAKVKQMYRKEEIVLDYNDHNLTEIEEFKSEWEKTKDILSNGDNCYLIEEDYVHFWGLDIDQKKCKIDEKVKDFISSRDFNLNEVCEFNQDEDFELFRLLY